MNIWTRTTSGLNLTRNLSEAGKQLAFVVPNLVIFENMLPLINKAPIDFDIIVPRYVGWESGWQEMAVDTFEVIAQKGFRPRWSDEVTDICYECAISPYWNEDISLNCRKNIRLMYGLAKESWNFDYWNVFYDLILTFGPYDSEYLNAFTETVSVGPIKLAAFNDSLVQKDFILEKWGGDPTKKTILYLPTYGDASSIDELLPVMLELKAQYNVIVKLHHGTYFLEKARTSTVMENFKTASHGDLLGELLACADVVVSDGSGAIFDSICANKPTIIYQPRTPKQYHGKASLEEEVIREGICPVGYSSNDIPQLIQSVIESDTYIQCRNKLSDRIFVQPSVDVAWTKILDVVNFPLNENFRYYGRQAIRAKITQVENNLKACQNELAINKEVSKDYGISLLDDWKQLALKSARNEVMISEYQRQISELESKIDSLSGTISTLKESHVQDLTQVKFNQAVVVTEKDEEIKQLRNEIQAKYDTLNLIYSSNSWKAVTFYWSVKDFIKKPVKKILQPIRDYKNKANARKLAQSYKTRLQQILSEHPDVKGIVIYPPTIDWGYLFQRPQQLAIAFAKLGYLFFYCTQNYNVDSVQGFEKERENLFLANVPMEVFEDITSPILLVSWTVNKKFISYLNRPVVIYDYIDDLNVFHQFDQKMIDDHKTLVQSADVVCATADKLYKEVTDLRGDALLCPNAVDYDVFNISVESGLKYVPADIKHLVDAKKRIIGYYGALANWFDYDLIEYTAQQITDWEVVLIGPDYDGSIHQSQILKIPNVTWLGSKNYNELPYYLFSFDVATIPFKVNEITEATSPVKLFEYMAGNRPIVTTEMPECKKYKSVFVSHNYDEFISNIQKAMGLKGQKEYEALLREDALANTWLSRAKQIVNSIERINSNDDKK